MNHNTPPPSASTTLVIGATGKTGGRPAQHLVDYANAAAAAGAWDFPVASIG